MERSMFVPVVTKRDEGLPFYITTIGTTPREIMVNRPEGITSWQILYTEEGTGIVRIYDDVYRAFRGSLLVLPAGVPHDYHMDGDNWRTSWITFSGWGVERLFDLGAGIWRLPDDFNFMGRFHEIFKYADKNSHSYNSSVLLYSLLLECRDVVSEGIIPLYKLRSQLSECFRYIEKNYAKTIELSDLAAINGVSEEHFCRIFKSYTGMRPFEYIKNLRIQRAKEYLYEHKKIKVREIAKMTGFQSENYFCTVFKKTVGMTPLEYREIYGV